VDRPEIGSAEIGPQPPIGEVATPPVEPPVEVPQPAEDGAVGSSRQKAKANRKKQGYEWLVLVAASLAVALVVRGFLIQAFYIPSESMVPTLHIGDRVLVNKMSYDLHDVHRGDIVVFERPSGETDPRIKDLIKRVIGLPGETIEAREGRVLVNDRVLAEPYLPSGTTTTNIPRQLIRPNHVFVMGDNRSNSRDSRVFGQIPDDIIVGRAFIRVWPIGDLSLL
jgi:signal peptidase I